MAGGFHRPRNSIQPCALPAIHRRGANKQLNTSPRAWPASWGLLAAPPLRQPGIQAPPAVWRAHGIRRSQMRRRYEGAHWPVQRPPWVIRRASCGVAVLMLCGPGVMQAPIAIELRAQAGPGRGPRPAGLGLERASGRAFGLLHGRPPESPGPREQGGARATSAVPRGLRVHSRAGSTPAAGPGGPPVGAGRGVLAAYWRRPPWLVGCCMRRRSPGIKPE